MVWKRATYIAIAMIEKKYRGTVARKGRKTWKDIQKEYRVGATLPVTDRAISTVRNFPKLPEGLSIASTSPPTFPLS